MKHNTIGPVYIIRNRENKSDPGTNTGYIESENLYIAEDVKERDIPYMKYSIHGCSKHKLTSLFDVAVSNSGSVTISNGIYNRTYTNNTRNNSEDVLTMYKGSHELDMEDDAIMFDIQIAFLQKRCGDWLQVLSCADTSRDYLIRGTRQNMNDCIPYYCSSDRVSVAYALYIGINTILKSESGYQFFRADPTRFSYMSCEGWFNRTYATYSTSNYAETVEILQRAVAFYEGTKPLFIELISKIKDASTATDIKDCMKYAIRYRWFLSEFSSMPLKKDYIIQFSADPMHAVFSERDGAGKEYIITAVHQYTNALRRHTDEYIHSDIYDKSYAEFNPLAFQTGLSRSPFKYNTIFGQSLLYMLLGHDDEEGTLKRFVQVCIQKICDLAEDDSVTIHYSYFLARHSVIQMGGGEVTTVHSNAELLQIGTYLIEFLNDRTLVGRLFKSHKTTSHSLGTDSLCEQFMRHIALRGVLVPDYLAFLEKTYDLTIECEISETYRFLKSQLSPKIDTMPSPTKTHIVHVGGIRRVGKSMRNPRRSNHRGRTRRRIQKADTPRKPHRI